MPYFDTTNAEHKKLLPKSIRSDEDLENIAALAEVDIIAYFTETPPSINYTARHQYLRDGVVSTEGLGEDITAASPGDGAITPQLRVMLRGYKADADDPLVDPNFALAMRRTVALVTRWRLHDWKREPGVQSSSDSLGKSRTYRDNADDVFPPEWDRYLRPFKSDEPLWAL